MDNRSLAEKIGAYSQGNAADNTNQMPEDFIVQNVTPGPHFVSDIRLNFGPREAIDLTWEDPRVIKSSNNLKSSLRSGILRRLSREDFDKIEENKNIREREALRKSQKNRTMNSVTDADGNERFAEVIDASKPYAKGGEVSIDGYANDSMTFVMALDIAQAEAKARGYELSLEDFSQRVESDPQYISRLIKTSSTSGDPRRGRAVFAESPSGEFGETSTRATQMSNLNNDGYIAGDQKYQFATGIDVDFDASDAPGIADEIDLLSEVDSQQESGAIRRK
jgi:hypothetical protein